MLQNKLNSLFLLDMSTVKGSLSWLDKVLVICFEAHVHIPVLAVSSDVNLFPVQFSRVAGSLSSYNSHLCSIAAAPPSPYPPTPHPAFRHSSAGRYSSARWSTLLSDGWRMSNTALLPLSYDVDWHHEDLSLCDFVIFSLLLLLSLHFYRPESSEFSLRLRGLFFFFLNCDNWHLRRCGSGGSVNTKASASEKGTFFLFKK